MAAHARHSTCHPSPRGSTPVRGGLALVATLLVAALVVPTASHALLITSSGDAALSGALVEDFDGTTADTYFATQTFSIGADGFTVTPLADDLHIDDQYCASFGTSGNCLDTLSSANGANDDFDLIFSGAGVMAFGFDLTALDTDWTVETYDATDTLLSTYVIPSQSPGLTGFNRRGYFGATETAPIQYITVRSAADDRALIDNLAYVPYTAPPVPEPNVSMLLGLGLLALAGTRYRE